MAQSHAAGHIHVLSDHHYTYCNMLAKIKNIHDKYSIELMWWLRNRAKYQWSIAITIGW